ncbi:hypothetical protein WJ96_05040 [Burkholderia ubonensis]|uniref:Uncharacterized protein n=1 Tax=Burkholderia ubonensis TaxID=101571 RepID=A0AAW3MY67_9BURK|nr:hypothetical protein [Burkholderia ubonensis]KVP75129.1 hypothetical protein WJ93_06860 [Burkholderia ubonensis]KVP97937.1 hypothetical protein WJ96_05040 [Burkholderia ubonensis]KVZ92634.1 hypothetical protein WL25_16695 [Burkholderia ubonensis]
MAEQQLRNQENSNPRSALEGWRHHPKATRVLLGLMLLGLGAGILLPKAWEVVRMAGYTIGMFCAGMLAAREAAIWQRTDG